MSALISQILAVSNKNYFNITTSKTKKSNNAYVSNKKVISFNPAKYMKKIASANSVIQLTEIKGSLYAQISAAKNSGADKDQIIIMTRKIQNAIRKADSKIDSLNLEKKIEKKKEDAKKSKEKAEKAKAKRIDKLLKQKRLNRKAKEYNDIYEAEKEGIISIEAKEDYSYTTECGYITSASALSDNSGFLNEAAPETAYTDVLL